MIVKVQLPLFSNDKKPPALIYSEGKKVIYLLVPPEELPPEIRECVEQRGGKAFFEARLCDTGEKDLLVFDGEVEDPGW